MRCQLGVVALVVGLAVAHGPASAQHASRAWFGFGLSCSNCGWQMQGSTGVFTFSEPPILVAIEPGSPAERSGLLAGDRLVLIDGLPLTARGGAVRFSAVRSGERVRFEVLRAGQPHRADLEAGAWPASAAAAPVDTPAVVTPSLPARYSGRFGGLDIDVRGSPAVTVTIAERDCWMEIVTKDARIRLRGDASCNAARGNR